MAIKKVLLFLALPLALVAREPLEAQLVTPENRETAIVDQWETTQGDNEKWRMPGFDSDQWERVGARSMWKLLGGEGQGLRWYRRSIFIKTQPDPHRPFVIRIPAILSAYELYWDGVLIGGSGVVGDSQESETVGRTAEIILIPHQRLYPGTHTLSIRISNFHSLSGAVDAPISIGYFATFMRETAIAQGILLFLAGIFFIMALFHLFVFVTPREYLSNIVRSLFSLSCAGHILIYTYFHFWHVSMASYYTVAIIGDLFWFGMMSLLPIFLLLHFKVRFRRIIATWVLATTFIVVLLPRLALYDIIPLSWLSILDLLNFYYAHFSIVVAIAITGMVTYSKRSGSRTILGGLLLSLFGIGLSSFWGYENGWAIGFAFLNIFITIAIIRQLSGQRKRAQQAELRSTRLELELLKKHIQPHFLLNSLNSIVAWMEEEPAVAMALVNALSRELRLLMAFAGEKMIPLQQEIKLCRTHLEVMNMRQEKEITFEVEGECEGLLVPPLILHTLVENGLSHGFRKQDQGVFKLTCKRRGKMVRLILVNNGSSESRGTHDRGTGSRYIVSRLRESFGERYAFQSRPSGDGWKAMIRFRMVEE